MTREKKKEKIKKIMKEYIEEAKYGLFNTRNIAGDCMQTLFDGKFFTLDFCYYWSYFEVFGTNKKEFNKLKDYYESIGGIV